MKERYKEQVACRQKHSRKDQLSLEIQIEKLMMVFYGHWVHWLCSDGVWHWFLPGYAPLTTGLEFQASRCALPGRIQS